MEIFHNLKLGENSFNYFKVELNVNLIEIWLNVFQYTIGSISKWFSKWSVSMKYVAVLIILFVFLFFYITFIYQLQLLNLSTIHDTLQRVYSDFLKNKTREERSWVSHRLAIANFFFRLTFFISPIRHHTYFDLCRWINMIYISITYLVNFIAVFKKYYCLWKDFFYWRLFASEMSNIELIN